MTSPPSIRVATYNIRKCVGLDWRRRPDRIMRVLGELEADVVALQEADRRLGERSATLSLEELPYHTGLRPVSFEARGTGGGDGLGWHGNAILVREEAAVRSVAALDLPSFEPRGALVAELEVKGVALRVAGVHLGLIPADRRRQARALIERLDGWNDGGAPALPTVVLGDLNEWSERAGSVAVLAERFRPAPPVASFHSAAPLAALDRIFVGPGLQVAAAGVHRSAEARRASDHLPVWATLLPVEAGARSGRDAAARETLAC
ncbi:Metal-dependent hydrolase, endonuclease/exonuclease/phosphatase family [Tistlia consotensis]|uniref:Metal-dependent hydrolase, endonuclease/exonuclease/phosphatase family n=1 Tax=Tistlia consotensis USBA 355 TaxID=560819 RepID=A0A1Y6CBG8_9PROT|nr:endonuclease/exonuclease/phosphatase family protein [Tistlia consotensis]SMF46225.1 Metal-dependent hydrolase, endonuclease/exonuclease/phosphatase family [Tistlia consotensis USBA 355]SNR78747.1 Metal-dependent hydrolase, endonuclease/exonuclease/phosphatase family [Tistlia consotensis]